MLANPHRDGVHTGVGHQHAARRAHHHMSNARHMPRKGDNAPSGRTHWLTRLAGVLNAAIARAPHTRGGPKAIDDSKVGGQHQPTRGEQDSDQATSAVRKRERSCNTAFV